MRLNVFCSWISLFISSSLAGNYLEDIPVVTEPNDELLLSKWADIEKNLGSNMDMVLKQVLPMLIRSSTEVDISDQCSQDILKMVLGLKQFKKWPLLMVDASGKIPSGVFSGTSAELGNYDQCVSIEERNQLNNELLLQGRYCVVDIRLPLAKRTKFLSYYHLMPPLHRYNTTNYFMEVMKKIHHFAYFLAFRLGLCFPSTCEKQDIQNIATYMANQAHIIANVTSCEVKEELHLDTTQIINAIFIGSFVVLCLIGSAIHTIFRIFSKKEFKESSENQGLLTRILLCFSLEKNITRIAYVDPNRDKKLGCIHGIRFLSMAWIILGHTYLLADLQLIKSALNGRMEMKKLSFQIIANALVAVDTFFFLSGFLLSNLSINHNDSKGGKGFNPPLIFFRRIWRLLPSTVVMVSVAILVPLIGSGPLWHENIDIYANNCRKKWWADFIFVNNFVHPSKMCLPHTWYTAADMQMFIVGIIYLLIFFRSVKWGSVFNIFIIIASIASTAAINYYKGFPPILLISQPVPQDMIDFWQWAHCKPHSHISAFCVGLALGTFVTKYKKIKLSVPVQLLFWCLSITCNLSIMFSTYEWNNGNEPSQEFAAFYAGIHRTAWAVGLSWVVFACINGYGGFINRILSWDGFVPLSRLTFMAYLWHYLIIIMYNAYWRTGVEAKHVFIVWMFFGNLVVTFLMSFVSYIIHEGPFVHLERILMSFIIKTKEIKEEKHPGVQFKNSKPEDHQLPHNGVNGSYVARL